MPKVSILLPVYNAAPYLGECLDSILHQTFEDWELIAVNDFSTDSSEEILNSYALQDRRIHIFSNKSKGIIPALRMAYSHAKGDLITRMDADDVMLTNKLHSLQQALLNYGEGYLSTGCVEYFSENTLGEGYLKYAAWLNRLTSTGDNWSDLYKECVIPSPCWMSYKSDLDKIGGFTSDLYPEDYDLVFRWYAGGLNVIPSSEIIHRWRDHGDRASRNDPNYLDNRFISLKVRYFIDLHLDQDRTLVLRGAGKKGKAIARELIQYDIPFIWATNNPEKIGKSIYAQQVISDERTYEKDIHQTIIAIANPAEQDAVVSALENQGHRKMLEYFCFC